MTDKSFRDLLLGAVTGNHSNIVGIMELYEPLINKYSHIAL